MLEVWILAERLRDALVNSPLGKPSRNFKENRLFYFHIQTLKPNPGILFVLPERSYTMKHVFLIVNIYFGHSLLLFANYIIVYDLVAVITLEIENN